MLPNSAQSCGERRYHRNEGLVEGPARTRRNVGLRWSRVGAFIHAGKTGRDNRGADRAVGEYIYIDIYRYIDRKIDTPIYLFIYMYILSRGGNRMRQSMDRSCSW